MANEHPIYLDSGSSMAVLESISWGPSASLAPLKTVLIPDYAIIADSTTPGVNGTVDLVGNLTVGPGGMVSGTLIQVRAVWDTGSLSADYNNTPTTIGSIDANGTLHIDWRSVLGGDDTFDQHFTQGDVIDGGKGLNTVDYSDNRSGYTITRAGNTVQVKSLDNPKQDTLISIQQIKFADQTVNVADLPDSGPPNPPVPSYIASGITAGAFTLNPTTVNQAADNAFFQWGAADASKNGADLTSTSEQAQINTGTLYLDGFAKFLASTPGGENAVAATAGLFQGLNSPTATPGLMGAWVDILATTVGASFGSAANGIVFQIEFGAMGFALGGSAGLQSFGTFGKNVGDSLGSLSGGSLADFSNTVGAALNTAFHAG